MEAWRKLSERLLYDGYWSIVGRRYETPDGVEREFEIKAEEPVVAIVAVTAELEVLLVREFRPGPQEVLLELPGGAIDGGEEPHEAARRELREETGYAGELQLAGTILDCAYSNRIRHYFVAADCVKVQDPTPHDGEFAEVVLMPLPDFRRHLRSGRLTDVAGGYLGLDFLNLL